MGRFLDGFKRDDKSDQPHHSALPALERRWFWSGEHYARTCNAWLDRMDDRKAVLRPLFEQTYGRDFASLWWHRWRMFFMACAELIGYRNGQEWLVAHYRFIKDPA